MWLSVEGFLFYFVSVGEFWGLIGFRDCEFMHVRFVSGVYVCSGFVYVDELCDYCLCEF